MPATHLSILPAIHSLARSLTHWLTLSPSMGPAMLAGAVGDSRKGSTWPRSPSVYKVVAAVRDMNGQWQDMNGQDRTKPTPCLVGRKHLKVSEQEAISQGQGEAQSRAVSKGFLEQEEES